MPHDLKSPSHLAMVRTLSDLLIEVIREDDTLGDGPVADRLLMLRDAVWPDNSHLKKEDRDRIFAEALTGLNTDQKTHLLQAYARMGHLYDIAALAARENYFAAKGATPGGIDEFAAKQPDLETAVGKLNQPVFEVVMTQHPTNTNSLEFMQAQRQLARAIEIADLAKVKQAMQQFASESLLRQREEGQKIFSVRDESRVVLNFLGNIYEDLPRIYVQYDKALGGRFKEYDPLSLNLQMRFGSWGSSGDKDGNNSVTAETTLEAIAMHSQTVMKHYLHDLEAINLSQLEVAKKSMRKELHELDSLVGRIGALRKMTDELRVQESGARGIPLSNSFDKLSQELSKQRAMFNPESFTEMLSELYREVPAGENKDKLLDLIRKVRIFGSGFSKIEYRETAEEYGRVVSVMVKGYKDMSPHERVETLTRLLQSEGNEPCRMYEAVKEKIRLSSARNYSPDDPLPIAYHTIKRMQLARDYSDMIKDNVLAECGRLNKKDASVEEVQAQAVANMLEALFLQKAVEKDGRKPLLGIVPLFEEPSTMENVESIMRGAYDNPAYQAHLAALAEDRYDGKKTQQVQIAHSDNARRSGLQAARGYIHEAHKKLRALNDEVGIRTQFFEGGSISDAYRNGVRAISASVNAFELHDFAKFTFQGGDLLNYFNAPISNVRVFTRNLVHPAERFTREGHEWKAPRRSKDRVREIFDTIAITALKRTLTDYQKDDFTTDKMGVLLAALDYEGETQAGTKVSRSDRRGPSFVSSATAIGAIQPVPIEKVRTIGFSEAWQHAGIVPSWIGSKNLLEYLTEEASRRRREIVRKEDEAKPLEKEFLDKIGVINVDTGLTPQQVKLFRENSSAFSDAQDRSAFALALTDPDALAWLGRHLGKILGQTETGKRAKGYLNHILRTYRQAGKTAHAALKGEELDISKKSVIQQTLTQDLNRLTADIERKGDYRRFLLHAKIEGGLSDEQRDFVHNGGDTVVHGRYLPADDPAYGEKLAQEKEIARGVA